MNGPARSSPARNRVSLPSTLEAQRTYRYGVSPNAGYAAAALMMCSRELVRYSGGNECHVLTPQLVHLRHRTGPRLRRVPPRSVVARSRLILKDGIGLEICPPAQLSLMVNYVAPSVFSPRSAY